MTEEFAPDSRTITNGQIWELRSQHRTETFIVAQIGPQVFRLIHTGDLNRYCDNACFGTLEEGESFHYIGSVFHRKHADKPTHKIEVVKL